MYKNILMLIALFLVLGCSDKEPTLEEVKSEESNVTKVDVESREELNSTKKVKDRDIYVDSSNEVNSDFIPEHIRLSHIEVVEH